MLMQLKQLTVCGHIRSTAVSFPCTLGILLTCSKDVNFSCFTVANKRELTDFATTGWPRSVGSINHRSLLQNIVCFIGLFAKETYDFKEPTNCSHPIVTIDSDASSAKSCKLS